MGPFEVTKEMVTQLSDEGLRRLLSTLLNAEAKRLGISPAAIAVGGNQTAADGGVDASISWTGKPTPGEWLPRRTIYFQCKAEQMRPSALSREMRPTGKPRPIFEKLASQGGAYVVFTTDDPTGSAQERRIEAMQRAVSDVPGAGRIHLEFYGADKIARWTNQHLGVALQVLEQIGRSLGGWRPYGDWSAIGSSAQPYVLDDKARAVIDGEELDVASAIRILRSSLAQPGSAVRIVGISGMGKTRLAEALFDERVSGGTALPQKKAVYGDVGLDLSTSAVLLTEQLVLAGVDAIVVADNSNIRTHGQLAQLVARPGSRASLLTIDYDATGDRPFGTTFVSLLDNSEDVLAEVLRQRCPHLSQAERRHLAEFSGGNARIALKIAERGRSNLDLSKLDDTELLERLFQTGRVEADVEARKIADAASLVYAFYVQPSDGHQPEHAILAEIAGVSKDTFYRHVATFLDWGIAQQRGPQRAIMPPPLATMLATRFVRKSDPETLLEKFNFGPTRLFASFARRLGHLHSEPVAVSLVRKLFDEGQRLAQPLHLDGVLLRAFINAAPAAPEAALEAIERELRAATPITMPAWDLQELGQLLVYTAYEPALFDRAMEALLILHTRSCAQGGDSKFVPLLLERFWPVLSFTLADGRARLAFVDRLLDDSADDIRALGVEALNYMLETGTFSSPVFLELGARPRLTEWQPHGGDYETWLKGAFRRLLEVAASGATLADRCREIIADHLRGHLANHGLLAIEAMRSARPPGYWDAGWRAVSEALHFTRASLNPDILKRTETLESELRPASLEHCFEAFVLKEPWRHYHPKGVERRYTRKVASLAEAVGRCVGRDPPNYRCFLRRAVTATGFASVGQFGRGLAHSAGDLDDIWRIAIEEFCAAPEDVRHPGPLAGILEGAARRNVVWANARLDEAAVDTSLADHLVSLQVGLPLDARSLSRFTKVLEARRIHPSKFRRLMSGGVTKDIPADSLASFLQGLFEVDDGVVPALEVLHMRLYGDRVDEVPIERPLINLGRNFLADARTFQTRSENLDHGIGFIARSVLTGEGAVAATQNTCAALRRSAETGEDRLGYTDYNDVCGALASMHPRIVLEEFLASDVNDDLARRFFGGLWTDDEDRDAKVEIEEGVLLDWVAEDPSVRAPRVARFVRYAVPTDGGTLAWSPLALKLIEVAPVREAVLEAFEQRFWSGSSWGPISGRFVRRRPLVAAFLDDSDAGARRWARAAARRLEETIKYWDEADRGRESRFE